MSDEETNQPEAPPGLPPMPPMPEAPPAPPGMPAMPPMPEAPPAPPGMPAMPPMPEAPPAPPGMPAMPPMPEAPPAPPGMPAMPPMPEAPPAPPGMPAMPPMPEAPPAPPGMPAMPPMPEAPPAPPEMPPMPEAPPAPPEMPPMPEAPPGLDLLAPAPPAMPEAPPAPPEMPPMPEAPPGLDLLAPAPPEMPPMPEAPPGLDLLAPAPPEMPPMPEAPPAPPEMPPMPEASLGLDLLAPVEPAEEDAPPAPPSMDLLSPLTPVEETVDSPEDELLTPLATPDPLAAMDTLTPTDENPVAAGEIAGATIRSSVEVDEVPGDKLEGTLHEIEESTLTAEGTIVKQSIKGTLTVNNPSADDRIYDIDVLLDNADSTDIGGDQISVDELEAGKNYVKKYSVSDAQMLVLREKLDTNPARNNERSLSIALSEEPGTIALEMEVENVSSVALRDIVVTRNLPDSVQFNHTAGATVEGNTMTWEVGALHPGEKQVLSIEGHITVTSSKTIKAGSAQATYKADATLSNLSFRDLDAFCRGFTYMRVREDERPDNWICQTIFENRSSFAVDLVKLQVRMKGSDDLLFDVNDVKQDVHPQGKWESEERNVMATAEPDFTYDLSYTVLPRAVQKTEGTIKLEESSLTVVDADISKNYSTDTLKSFRQQHVSASLKVKNTGSATINLMRITDDIPGLFQAPDMDAMAIIIDGKELPVDQWKGELSAGITLEKEHRSPDGEGHTMTLTVGTKGPIGLKPGKTMEVKYKLNAPDPSPANERVDAPARFQFSSEQFGPVCLRDVPDAPSVRVSHLRRNFSAGKQAIPMGGKGRYEVLILFENNGDTALQDVFIKDVIPSNFEIKDWHVRGAGGEKRTDVDMTTNETEDGIQITWKLPVVGKGERLDVSFEIKGEGEIDAEALNRFHGAHFGDELESAEDDTPAEVSEETTEEAPAAEEESVEEETAEEESVEEEIAEEKVVAEEPAIKFREDIMLRVMEEFGIEDRDAFLEHSMNFDLDDNGYLKKAEFVAAAEAFTAGDASEEESTEEESVEDAESEVEESSESKTCPICSTSNDAHADTCTACGYTFE
ncbi:MAG: hypothetical protein ISR25_03460 [Candidatus Poseidoniaceae archaeon]|nr:hypothetical protein [Candidatus Poseidoniaceae archaeon]